MQWQILDITIWHNPMWYFGTTFGIYRWPFSLDLTHFDGSTFRHVQRLSLTLLSLWLAVIGGQSTSCWLTVYILATSKGGVGAGSLWSGQEDIKQVHAGNSTGPQRRAVMDGRQTVTLPLHSL